MKQDLLSPLLYFILVTFSMASFANDISPEELERWFNTDSLDPPRYDRVTEVNEGELVFFAKAPKEHLHHHHNSVTILPNSLNDGWILIKQCHSNIDKAAAVQILFKAGKVKNIKVVSSKNIGKAWVEGASVQMEEIKADATLCIQALTQSLIHHSDGTFSLHNGPFMRRFLDGYFPLHVSFDLDYAQTDLELIHFSPVIQAGYKVEQSAGKIMINTIFEGRLHTEFYFKQKSL